MPRHVVAPPMGLVTNGNRIAGPQGACVDAENCIIHGSGVIEPRFGFGGLYAISPSQTMGTFFNYQGSVYMVTGESPTLQRAAAGPWIPVGTAGCTDSEGMRLRTVQQRRNLYTNTAQRIASQDSIDTVGVPRGLDMEYALSGTTGWLPNNSRAAFRMTWSSTDNNSNTWEGAPSGRLVVENTAGGSRDVSLSFTIPDDITVNHTYNIYRSSVVDNTLTPNDELQLVITGSVTAAQISAGVATGVLDDTPEGARGASLYTNESQQGALLENNRPPTTCKDIALFKNHVFYANGIAAAQARVGLRKIGSGTDSLSTGTFTADVAIGSPVMSNVSSFTGICVGKRITGTGLAAGTVYTIASFNTGANTITLSDDATGNATGATYTYYETLIVHLDTDSRAIFGGSTESIPTGYFQIYTGGTTAQNLENTVRSIVRVANRYPTVASVANYAGTDDDPGQFLLEGYSFYVAASTGAAYDPPLPLPLQSPSVALHHREDRPGRVYFAKPDEPEHVPVRRNYFDVGDANIDIRRTVALRDSLICLKDDGAYRITGDGYDTFRVDILDPTIRIWAPRTVQVVNNSIFVLTTEGLLVITETGVLRPPISGPVDNLLADYYYPTATKTRDACWAAYLDSPKLYLLVLSTRDANFLYTPLVLVYSIDHQQWTKWSVPFADLVAGGVGEDSRLYLSAFRKPESRVESFTNHALRARRGEWSPGLLRYRDDWYELTVTGVSGNDLTVSEYLNANGVQVGDQARQNVLGVGFIYSHVASMTAAERGDFVGALTNGSPVITGVQFNPELDWSLIDVGYYLEDLDEGYIPAGTTIVGFDESTATITMSQNATGTSSGPGGRNDLRWTQNSGITETLTLDDATGFETGKIDLYRSYPVNIQFMPQHAGAPGDEKHWSELAWLFQSRELDKWTQSFRSDVTGAWASQNVTAPNNTTEHPMRVYLPQDVERCSQLSPKITVQRAATHFLLDGFSLSYGLTSKRVKD